MGWTTVCDLPMDSFQANRVLDTTEFNNHATIQGNIETRQGYVRYQGSDAQLEIPVANDSLARFAALRIQALIRPKTITRRFNIAEGWMSFAFIIESDGRLRGTIYDGHNWIGPDSGAKTIPPNEWSRVSFEYDGVSIGQLTINEEIVGRRLDMSPGLAQPQQVISLGHWPRGDGRYTLEGDLGHVRIDRRDHDNYLRDALAMALCKRRLSPRQAAAMQEIDLLAKSVDQAQIEEIMQCFMEQCKRMRVFLHNLRSWTTGREGNLQLLAKKLRAAWCCSYNASEAENALYTFFHANAGQPGSQERQRFLDAVEEFLQISTQCRWEGEPFDRIRELCLIIWPELAHFETDLLEFSQLI